MNRRYNTLLACLLVASVALLAFVHYSGAPRWFTDHLSTLPDGDGTLWQVQTTFLSVGFAGLTIAAQLFAESPLAIGASRGRVLEYVGAHRFVTFGLTSNMVIGIETIWLSSGLGVLGVSLLWLLPTVVLLVKCTLQLVDLYGHPTLLDELIRTALATSLTNRLEEASNRYLEATKQLDGLFASDGSLISLSSSAFTFRVPVPRAGEVVKAINPNSIKQARALLAYLLAPDIDSAEAKNPGKAMSPYITRYIDPGDRTRLGETAFQVFAPAKLDERRQAVIVRILQASVEFEPEGAVTTYEEINREIAHLKDSVGTSIRSGAFSTAERALKLTGHVIRAVWLKSLDGIAASRRESQARRKVLFRSIGDVEQDAVLSPRAAAMFVDEAMNRALEAPRTGSSDYVDECLRSFTRIWLDVLREGRPDFDQTPSQIVICLQSLAAYSDPDQREALSTRATWAIVELVKFALDVRKSASAILAATVLGGLFRYSNGDEIGRTHVRAGQLVLAGWLDYLADKRDDRNPTDAADLRKLVTPGGTKAEIVDARHLAERGENLFSRWDLWETNFSGTVRAQVLELSHYIDKAQLAALALADGSLPPASNQATASEYQRFMQLLDEPDNGLSESAAGLQIELGACIAEWNAAENERLASAPLSDTRVDALRNAVVETLEAGQRLADAIPRADALSADADVSLQTLALNLLIPRHYLVDDTFHQTYADPTEIGDIIARSIIEGEERQIIGQLLTLEGAHLGPTVQALREHIDALGDQAGYYVLLTPYGGLLDLNLRYSNEFSEAFTGMIHIETSILDDEAILFDTRTSVVSYRGPEEKEGLTPIGDTSIAVGVFDDAQESDEPRVRVEVGEYFVVWPGADPRVYHIDSDPMTHPPSCSNPN